MVTVAASTGSAAGFGLYLVQVAVLFNVSSSQGQWVTRDGRGIMLAAMHVRGCV